jgi:hypothetical protein
MSLDVLAWCLGPDARSGGKVAEHHDDEFNELQRY